MQYITPEKWSSPNNLVGLLFFVQRMLELSYAYTDQRYKSPSVSITGLIEEAIGILDRRWAEDSIAKQVAHIIDELRPRVVSNRALADILHMPVERYLSLDLLNPRMASVSLKAFLAEINEEAYLSSIVDHVVKLSEQSRAKAELDFLATEFISTLTYLGVSREHINRTLLKHFFGESVVDANTLFEFVKSVYPHYHEYKVFVPASENLSEFDEDALDVLQIGLAGDIPKQINAKSHGAFLAEASRDGFSVYEVRVKAMDYSSAAAAAKAKIDRFASIFQILSHKWSYEVGTSFACQQTCCSKIIENVSVGGNAMHHIKDNSPNRARAGLVDMLSARSLLKGPDRAKYLNIIEIHGISARLSTADSQLINMWTCLETMSPGDGKGSNIDKVIDAVLPILTIMHVKAIVIALLLDLFRWNRRKFSRAFSKYGEFSSSRTHRRFVEMITDDVKTVGLEYLLEELGDFELLRYRLYKVAKMLRSKELLVAEIDQAEKTIRWNLHRIYRMRNNVVHSGKSKRFTRYLVEDVHSYFDQCMEFCVSVSKRSTRFNSFELCFRFAMSQHAFYRKVVSSNSHIDHCVWDFKATKGKGYIFQRDSGDQEV